MSTERAIRLERAAFVGTRMIAGDGGCYALEVVCSV